MIEGLLFVREELANFIRNLKTRKVAAGGKTASTTEGRGENQQAEIAEPRNILQKGRVQLKKNREEWSRSNIFGWRKPFHSWSCQSMGEVTTEWDYR